MTSSKRSRTLLAVLPLLLLAGGSPDYKDRPCLNRTITIAGTDQGEAVLGTSGNDVISARGGNDVIVGGGGNDRICGGRGNDTIHAGDGYDRANGGAGDDLCTQSEQRKSC